MDNIVEDNETYAGKYLHYQGIHYSLAPEVIPKGCLGCARYSAPGCPLELTKHCSKGYVLQRIKL